MSGLPNTGAVKSRVRVERSIDNGFVIAGEKACVARPRACGHAAGLKMAFEKPPRLRGLVHFLAERLMRNGFKCGGGGGAFSQGALFRGDGGAGSCENLKCLEMIVLPEIFEIRKR